VLKEQSSNQLSTQHKWKEI